MDSVLCEEKAEFPLQIMFFTFRIVSWAQFVMQLSLNLCLSHSIRHGGRSYYPLDFIVYHLHRRQESNSSWRGSTRSIHSFRLAVLAKAIIFANCSWRRRVSGNQMKKNDFLAKLRWICRKTWVVFMVITSLVVFITGKHGAVDFYVGFRFQNSGIFQTEYYVKLSVSERLV